MHEALREVCGRRERDKRGEAGAQCGQREGMREREGGQEREA